ncbi:adenine phosphoribosyltransferase [Chromatiales bacterium (ex Bugula neritina AB1)]|nr:adenine phosphoribosyltransferase [Chromatiales bacterium (ex Bugula neritina AB1)]
MDREKFRQNFGGRGVAVLPVIHVLDNQQAERNIERARDGGCPGVFLINHDFPYERFLPIIRHCRLCFPDYWIGVNFLAVTGKTAFPILAELRDEGVRVDAYWADDARIDEKKPVDNQPEASEIAGVRNDCNWNGLYFGGTAFKKQREIDPADYARSATIACEYMDVVTTSGIATGHSADLGKIETFRRACGDSPVALASGITPENVSDYAPWVDAVLVATGINIRDDFYTIDPARLAALLSQISH